MRHDEAFRPRGFLARSMVAGSARLNHEMALRFAVPFLTVAEFPRSGGNWIRDMLADAMQLPAPRFSRLPISFAALAHSHDHRPLPLSRAIYVARDPRDVFLSHYQKTRAAHKAGAALVRRRLERFHPSLASGDRARFLEEWTSRSMGARVGWGAHVAAWAVPGRVLLRYEDMHAAPAETLGRAVEQLTGAVPTDAALRFAVARDSFAAQTGRQAGEADDNATRRSGVAGGWKEALDPGLAEAIRQRFGAEMDRLGYR